MATMELICDRGMFHRQSIHHHSRDTIIALSTGDDGQEG